MLTIYLTRHGETEDNKKSICQGRIDNHLNSNGYNETIQLANNFKSNNIHFDLYVATTLSRSYETISTIQKVINDYQPIIIMEDFIERDFGSLEGKNVDYVRNICETNDFSNVKNYETDKEVAKRFKNGIDKLCHQYNDKVILLVSHSHAIKCFLKSISPKMFSLKEHMPNICVTRLIIDDNNKMTIDQFNIFNANDSY